MKKVLNLKGFTIVEVSLVLAIAGLIFLMVFIALPMLQRSARDAEWREDMVFLANAIKKYQQNNRGGLPTDTLTDAGLSVNYAANQTGTTWRAFYSNYLGKDFGDPTSGSNYTLLVKKCTKSGSNCKNELDSSTNFPNSYAINIFTGAYCDGEHTIPSSNPRRIAIQYKLELGIYCGDL